MKGIRKDLKSLNKKYRLVTIPTVFMALLVKHEPKPNVDYLFLFQACVGIGTIQIRRSRYRIMAVPVGSL